LGLFPRERGAIRRRRAACVRSAALARLGFAPGKTRARIIGAPGRVKAIQRTTSKARRVLTTKNAAPCALWRFVLSFWLLSQNFAQMDRHQTDKKNGTLLGRLPQKK